MNGTITGLVFLLLVLNKPQTVEMSEVNGHLLEIIVELLKTLEKSINKQELVSEVL